MVPDIPAGKKLVLLRMFVHTFLTDSLSPMETRLTIGPGTIGQIFVSQTFQGTGGSGQQHFTGSADIDTVLTPGEMLTLFIFRTGNVGSSNLNFARASIFGYLVDAN